MAGAVMYVMGRIFHVPESLMLCAPDERRGRLLLENVMEGGNFGKYHETRKQTVFSRWLNDRIRPFRYLNFDAYEALWHEYRYAMDFFRFVPKRIRFRRWFFKKS